MTYILVNNLYVTFEFPNHGPIRYYHNLSWILKCNYVAEFFIDFIYKCLLKVNKSI